MEQSQLNEHRTTETPRVYVVPLSDYKTCPLCGRWIDADQPIETIREQIALMLAESSKPSYGYMICDYKNFGRLRLSAFENIDLVAQVAFMIVERGPIFGLLVSYLGGVSQVKLAQRYMYMGEFRSAAYYAKRFIGEEYDDLIMRLPTWIQCHIDYEGLAMQMELRGMLVTIEHDEKVHVFQSSRT